VLLAVGGTGAALGRGCRAERGVRVAWRGPAGVARSTGGAGLVGRPGGAQLVSREGREMVRWGLRM
jgi:hypothetical protein